MNYFISEIDDSGNVYSIDNLVLEYVLNHPNTKYIDFLHSLKLKYPEYEKEYYENLNKPYSSKWQFYNNNVHLCKGITTWFGKWTLNNNGDKTCFPIVKIEFNPNKYGNKPILNDLMDFIEENCGDSELKKYDIAIDFKCKPEDIIYSTRKEKGLHKGTRYYGQRNKDGYCKIYNKRIEQNLDYDLTRIEFTLSHKKQGKNHRKDLNIDDIFMRSGCSDEIILKSKPMNALYRLCALCEISNLDYREILDCLNDREKYQILGALTSSKFEKYEFDEKIHDRLIEKVYKIYHINKLHMPEEEDENGFIKIVTLRFPLYIIFNTHL